jgi:hypothetical protein
MLKKIYRNEVIQIPREYPDYLLCSICEKKIMLDYETKYFPKTDDVVLINVQIRHFYEPRKEREKEHTELVTMAVCNHCKGIINIK